MLACVCQPADPGLFRRSPIPLGTPPLKIASRAIAPIPGRGVRVSAPPAVPKNNESANAGQTPQSGEEGGKSSASGTVKTTSESSSSNSKSSSCGGTLPAVRRRCAKKCNAKCKHSKRGGSLAGGSSKLSDREDISSLTPDSADCDRKSEGKSNGFEKVWI